MHGVNIRLVGGTLDWFNVEMDGVVVCGPLTFQEAWERRAFYVGYKQTRERDLNGCDFEG